MLEGSARRPPETACPPQPAKSPTSRRPRISPSAPTAAVDCLARHGLIPFPPARCVRLRISLSARCFRPIAATTRNWFRDAALEVLAGDCAGRLVPGVALGNSRSPIRFASPALCCCISVESERKLLQMPTAGLGHAERHPVELLVAVLAAICSLPRRRRAPTIASATSFYRILLQGIHRGHAEARSRPRSSSPASSAPAPTTSSAPRSRARAPELVVIDGPGGVLGEAILIGEEIRRRHLDTLVAAHHSCASACAVVFLSGHTRYLGAGATVGLHSASYRRRARRPGSDGSDGRLSARGGRAVLDASPHGADRAERHPLADPGRAAGDRNQGLPLARRRARLVRLSRRRRASGGPARPRWRGRGCAPS